MRERTETAEVVVVGCGPGGAVLAYLLARSGIDVALVERAATFEREYRGFGWNPGVVRLFDEMDLLDDVLDLAHETVTDGAFSLYGEEISVLDFDLLDTDYPYALMMEQPALLECLVDRASSYDNFTFHPSTTVRDVRTDTAGRIQGIEARDRDAGEDVAFETQCVVGADGRYSTVRTSAGIDPGLFESPVDLVWFKLPRGDIDATTQGRIDRDGVLLYFGLGGDDLQIGYLVRSGEWPSIKQAGFDAFRERIAEIDPQVASAMAAQLDGFRDTTLLDVAPGIADTWSSDGLLLIGDAAHTASPIGAQGNPLAVEDAVIAHSLLVEELTITEEILERIGEFGARRRPHVEQIISRQRRGAANLAYWLDYGGYVPPRLARGMAKTAPLIVPHSKSVRSTIETFALGDRSVSVDRSHFTD
ncbi:FAD-dependent monooxygenase [Natronorubrum halophilum]|uniref:FAD-dependent monooxygenase n=1 Tax=Natronorubrum halophilum TaxID=1702106 RepID=UPI000EF65570|nr:FAD-dependent monooxygenase [Natronorubrum halophilum]